MKTLYADLETFSTVDLKCGTHAYAEKAEVLLFPYAIGEGEPQCWDVASGTPMPDDLASALQDQNVQTVWHNGGMFDLTILNAVKITPRLPHSRVFDTMACAYAHALPGGLEILGDVLGIAQDKAKHKSGKKLIQLFCKPLPKNSKLRRATSETHPSEWQQFIEYGKADITAMREVYKKIPKWNYQGDEYQLWLLDQKINQRGVAIDLALARGAVLAADKAKDILAQRTQVLTEGEVASATKRDAMIKHIFEAYGIPMPDMQMATLERRIADPDTPGPLKELLQVRLQASTSSVSKFNTLLKGTSSDGRFRGLLQFCGAGRTGRWSGRTFQPQNLMRPTLKNAEIEMVIDAIKADACDLMYDNVMEAVSNTARGCIVAPEGRKLVVADLANIEGRVAAWLASEAWKLKAFREYDEGTGPDLYIVAYAKSFGVPHAVVIENKERGDGTMRQVGKVQELMLQYQGGVGAFVTGAATYRVDLDDMAEKAYGNIPKHTREEAEGFLKWTIKEKRGTFDLADKTFVVCDALKRLWREAHPAISSFWGEIEDGYRNAVANPGNTFTVRSLKFRRDGSWLRIGLPSGRCLCYPSPQVDAKGTCSYMGMHQYTRKWQRISTYGGKLFENICQAVARDVMAHAMPVAEDSGYSVLLTVHDELITETPDTEAFSAAGLGGILSSVPKWGEGLPLAAAGFEGYRYRKD